MIIKKNVSNDDNGSLSQLKISENHAKQGKAVELEFIYKVWSIKKNNNLLEGFICLIVFYSYSLLIKIQSLTSDKYFIYQFTYSSVSH